MQPNAARQVKIRSKPGTEFSDTAWYVRRCSTGGLLLLSLVGFLLLGLLDVSALSAVAFRHQNLLRVSIGAFVFRLFRRYHALFSFCPARGRLVVSVAQYRAARPVKFGQTQRVNRDLINGIKTAKHFLALRRCVQTFCEFAGEQFPGNTGSEFWKRHILFRLAPVRGQVRYGGKYFSKQRGASSTAIPAGYFSTIRLTGL